MFSPRSPRTLAIALLAMQLAFGCSDDTASGSNGTGTGGGNLLGDTGTLGDSTFGDGGKNDTAVGDAGGGAADVVPDPGTFGAPCTGNGDCDSSLCVQTPDGKVCSKTCIEECPGNWNCVQRQVAGGDVQFICVPRFLYLCDPCNDNSDCNDPSTSGNVCVSFGTAGSFCGTGCDEVSPNCPNNYSCQAVVDPKTGLSSHQCVRESGLCTCSAKAVELALETTCTNQNLYGACKGSRFCGDHGLGQCLAKVPEQETCNGIDDDCDGKTDNFDASAPCDKTNQFGTCKGVILACKDGQTVCDAPDAKPEQCNGIDDNCNGQTDEGICDDGNDCTVDTCDTAGGCKHKGQSGIQCSDDGDPCTNDICNEDGQCIHKGVAGVACDDGSICTQTDKCLAGTCVGGNNLDCNDNDPCTADGCDPFTGCTHNPASDAVCTDDGNPCTLDQCQAGQCVHKPNEGGACTDDGKPCTVDVCKNGICTHDISSGPCDDGNPCTENDLCQGGACQPGTVKSCSDGKDCTLDTCDPKFGCQHNASAMDYKPCTASSSECPVGVCSGGGCFSKPNEPCKTKVKVNLCEKVDAIGACTAAGQCVAKSIPNTFTCSGCKSACFNCYGIPVCLDFLFTGTP